ncbi:MAG TPA: response regulator [Chloroflexota bacterium]
MRETADTAGAAPRAPTILVVDDEIAIIKVLRDFFEAEGFGVLAAHDGAEALAVLSREPVACVLLDIMMPGADGFEVCRQMRVLTDVPILFLTAREGDRDKLRGFRLGADDYIVKSASPDEIVARVKAVVRRARPPAPATPPQEAGVLDFGRLVLDTRAHAPPSPVVDPGRDGDYRHLRSGRSGVDRGSLPHRWAGGRSCMGTDGENVLQRAVDTALAGGRRADDHPHPGPRRLAHPRAGAPSAGRGERGRGGDRRR